MTQIGSPCHGSRRCAMILSHRAQRTHGTIGTRPIRGLLGVGCCAAIVLIAYPNAALAASLIAAPTAPPAPSTVGRMNGWAAILRVPNSTNPA